MFYDIYKYRWEITDKYGHSLSKEHLREYNLYNVLDTNSIEELNDSFELNYSLKIWNEKEFNIHNVLFCPNIEKLSIYPLIGNERDIRVNFKADSIQKCEQLLQLILDGNNLEPMKLYEKKGSMC